jgi:hypothetical protein
MLNELATSANGNTQGTKHALTLTQIRLAILFILHINSKCLALQEYLEVCIMLKNGMRRNLVDHALQGSPSGFYKVGIKTANGLFLWWWGNDDTGVVVV